MHENSIGTLRARRVLYPQPGTKPRLPVVSTALLLSAFTSTAEGLAASKACTQQDWCLHDWSVCRVGEPILSRHVAVATLCCQTQAGNPTYLGWWVTHLPRLEPSTPHALPARVVLILVNNLSTVILLGHHHRSRTKAAAARVRDREPGQQRWSCREERHWAHPLDWSARSQASKDGLRKAGAASDAGLRLRYGAQPTGACALDTPGTNRM
jgi:hypothetical protein